MEVVGLDQDYGQAELEDAGSSGLRYSHCNVDWQAWIMHFSAKTGKKGGRRGLRPWPLRCLSQFLSERESRLLGRRRLHKSMLEIVRTFHR